MRVTIKIEKMDKEVNYNDNKYTQAYKIIVDNDSYAMLIHTAKDNRDDNNLIFVEAKKNYGNIVSKELDKRLSDIMVTYESLYQLKNEYITEFDYEFI